LNLLQARIELRMRRVSDIVDLAFRLCVAERRVVLRLGAMTLLPCLALSYGFHLVGLSWAWVWTLAVVLGVVVEGAFTVAFGQLLFAETVRARDILVRFGRRLPSFLIALAWSRFLLALSALALLVPVIMVWPRIVFVHEASLLEGASPGAAFSRSTGFIKRVHGQVMALLPMLLLMSWTFVYLCEALGQGLVSFVLQLGEPFGALDSQGGSPFALLGFFLSVPYVAAARFLAYTDIRTRKEGWDIQVKFMAIQAREGTP
jgi:hypothetical protein